MSRTATGFLPMILVFALLAGSLVAGAAASIKAKHEKTKFCQDPGNSWRLKCK